MDNLTFIPLESESKIQKAILKEPNEDEDETPQKGQKAEILYKCRLNDFTVVDENEN